MGHAAWVGEGGKGKKLTSAGYGHNKKPFVIHYQIARAEYGYGTS